MQAKTIIARPVSRQLKRWHVLRLATLPLVSALSLAVAPAVYADEPVQANGTFTVSFSPLSLRTADGNTFIDYTFSEYMLGSFIGTRVGSGSLVIHPDGSFNTENSGIFTGTIAGVSGTALFRYSGSGTFTSAGGSFSVTDGTSGLAAVHAEGTDSGSATGPTSFGGTYSFKVRFSAP
jgi:hypothetical protein